MIGLALSLAFPSVPVGIFVLCVMAGVITCALGAPLTAILLVLIVSSTDPNMTALVALSSVVALMIGFEVRQVREKRAAGTVQVPQ